MFNQLILSILILFGFVNLYSQSKTDFDLMIDNGIEKMYQNPELGLKNFNAISIKNNNPNEELLVQYFVAKAFLLQGDYVAATQSVSKYYKEKKTPDSKILIFEYIQTIELLQHLKMYKQAQDLMANFISNNNFSQYKSKKELLFLAKFYQLQAVQFKSTHSYEKSLENLHKSSALLKTSQEKIAQFYLLENAFIEARIYLETNNISLLTKSIDNISEILKSSKENYYFVAQLVMLKAQKAILKNDFTTSNDYLNQALELIKERNFNVLEVEILNVLSQDYIKQKNILGFKDIQKTLEDKNINLDENAKEAKRNLLSINHLIQLRNLQIKANNNIKQLYVLGGICLVLIGTMAIFGFIERKKGETLDKQLDFATQHYQFSNFNLKTDVEQVKKQLVIPKETEREILKKLENFENTKAFTDSSISLGAVSSQLGTNTKYLSEIINKYKGKSFTTYINELRINYIAYLISSDTKYHQYKISYLAELAGFTNHSTFSVVFKQVTGVTPQKFIQQFSIHK